MRDMESLICETAGQTVSRETFERLEAHLELLRKWNPAINLVSPATLAEGSTRHILDSAQLLACMSNAEKSWMDFGSGGGFPGLVCAIIAAETAPNLKFTLVESDKRKAAFLANAVRTLNLDVLVKAERIESIEPMCSDIVSARAVASLTKLLEYAKPHLANGGKCIFPKGERFQDELRESRKRWNFTLTQKPSITDENAAILVLGEISRV